MRLRVIARHRYAVLAVLQPAQGMAVLSLLEDAKRFHPDLYYQMLAMLTQRAPTFDPPLGSPNRGGAGEKELFEGLFEFVALGGATRRRLRSRQSKEDRDLGLRIFYFRYGDMIICTNGCYKTSKTPEDAIPAALANKIDCLKALRENGYEIRTED
jgi:hypothetical protein